MTRSLLRLLALLPLLAAAPALAQPQIDIDGETPAFQSRQIESGPIKVSVSYEPYKYDRNYPDNYQNLHYQISYNGKIQIKAADLTFGRSQVFLQDLDGDRLPEVIAQTYSGGAHCCTNFVVHSWTGDRFVKAETGLRDAGGGAFKDLDNDGKLEFSSLDNAFFYAFESYAGSFPPSKIYAFRKDHFEDVTRQYPNELRSHLKAMSETLAESKREGHGANGVLAGYVAQKILLGEYEDGWKFMLENYDRTSDWGLNIYNKTGDVIGKYPDFPTALRAFLIEHGYLDAQGKPST